jgi:hypothetical protein
MMDSARHEIYFDSDVMLCGLFLPAVIPKLCRLAVACAIIAYPFSPDFSLSFAVIVSRQWDR